MEKYIKKYRMFEQQNQDADPYGEEQSGLQKGSLDYQPGGDIIGFLRNLENPNITNTLDKLLASDDLDERIDLADDILGYVDENFEEIYDLVVDDIKQLTLD